MPPLDVWEMGTEIVYAFDLQVAEDEISIEVHDDTLTVSGERRQTKEQNDRFFRFERRYGASRARSRATGRRRRGRDLGLVPEWSARGQGPEAGGGEAAAHPTSSAPADVEATASAN